MRPLSRFAFAPRDVGVTSGALSNIESESEHEIDVRGRLSEMAAPRWLKRTLTATLGTAVTLYAMVCGLMFVLQDELVFVPDREVARDPGDVGLAFDSLTLATDDGESIAAWFVPASEQPARGVVVYSHGNAGNLGNRVGVLEDLHGLGLDVLLYDYHGFGDSTGSPGESETYLDARAAWNWLTKERKIPPDRVVIWGRSLGGAVAVWLASQTCAAGVAGERPAGLIVESSFTSIPDVGAAYYPYLPVRLLNRHEYPSLARIAAVNVPVLVAHGPDDGVVPYAHGRELFAAAGEPKVFVELEGGHNDAGLASPAHRAALEAFLASTLDPL